MMTLLHREMESAMHHRCTCSVQQVCDDFEAVALVNQELLALGAVVHLLSVF